jgi:hypothetical protein
LRYWQIPPVQTPLQQSLSSTQLPPLLMQGVGAVVGTPVGTAMPGKTRSPLPQLLDRNSSQKTATPNMDRHHIDQA